jgi:hypothetical protein
MSSSKKANQKENLGGRRVGKTIAIVAALGWITAGVLIADKIQDNGMTSSLHGALVRSHSERRALSQELEQYSAELDTLKDGLSRYQSREAQTTTAP